MRALLLIRNRDTIVLSKPVFDEIAEVLGRAKFRPAISSERRLEILELLAAGSLWFRPTVQVQDCVDPDDNKYLELAAASGAALIVSSNRHLLALTPWNGVRILRPADYLVARGAD